MMSNKENSTTRSYVIGFILSLVFTIIPYHLVVNKVLHGNALLAVILGIGVLQMAIQLLFFLHLGRGPKPLYNVVFFFATAGVIVITIGASLLIMDNLYRNMSPEETIVRLAQEENIAQISGRGTGACTELGTGYIVTISAGVVSPARVQAKRCDILTFINYDDQDREIGFGAHPNHDGYGGIFEVGLHGDRPETITLNQAGEFIFHDHLDPTVYGYFSVEP